jgi:hypothetical protein
MSTKTKLHRAAVLGAGSLVIILGGVVFIAVASVIVKGAAYLDGCLF